MKHLNHIRFWYIIIVKSFLSVKAIIINSHDCVCAPKVFFHTKAKKKKNNKNDNFANICLTDHKIQTRGRKPKIS